ncbi:MAG TPA: polyhydroxyalkanoate synthesis regulator DNA-binding domain-containing protein [Tepidisphaeraceae bacterium]|nr:polyhydroxyalkanoate synthesis regulator DNA-binding domain-containing protein [Tepidisphaeraceae bacterium]
MSDNAGSQKRLTIKKYPNRRYYDATRSRHVTLEELYALIQDGYEVQVTDSKTGEDITAKVLAQIIIELDPFKLGVFPVPLLHRLLQSNEQSVSDFARRYFEQMLGAFLNSQRDLQNYWQGMMGFRPPGPTLADWARAMWGPLASPAPAASPSQPSGLPPSGASPVSQPSPAIPAAAQDQDNLRKEMDSLRAQLASLQQQLGGARPKKRRRNHK